MATSVPEGGRKYPDLKVFLHHLALSYTPCDKLADRIARRALLMASSDPDLLEGRDVKQDLSDLLHVLAVEELAKGGESMRL